MFYQWPWTTRNQLLFQNMFQIPIWAEFSSRVKYWNKTSTFWVLFLVSYFNIFYPCPKKDRKKGWSKGLIKSGWKKDGYDKAGLSESVSVSSLKFHRQAALIYSLLQDKQQTAPSLSHAHTHTNKQASPVKQQHSCFIPFCHPWGDSVVFIRHAEKGRTIIMTIIII